MRSLLTRRHRSTHLRLLSGGFTLVEMLIAVSIIAIISAVLMYQYTAFDSQLLLRNMAYEIALSVRQAQRLGTGVQQDGSGNFDRPYGVRFGLGPTYQLFRDTNRNYKYDNGEVVTTFELTRGNQIDLLCINTTTCGQNYIEFVFLRPDPDARIVVDGNTSSGASSATIRIASTRNPSDMRTITVSVTGQIAIQ